MDVAHQHDDIEINLSETDTLYLVDGQTVSISAGDVAMFWAGRPHQLLTDSGAARMCWATIPLPEFLTWNVPSSFVSELLSGGLHRVSPDDTALAARFSTWSRELASGSYFERETVRLELEGLSRRLAASTHRPASAHTNSRLSARMASFVADNCAADLSIEQVADFVHVHPKYAMALFRREIGITIGAYLTQCRVARAQGLLLTTDRSTAAIGFEAGFQSQSQFHDRFRKTSGLSPAAYRREHRAFD